MELFNILIFLIIVAVATFKFQKNNYNNLIKLNKKLKEYYQNEVVKYSDFIYPNRNIDLIFSNFNYIIKTNIDLNHKIIKKYTYTSNNLEIKLKEQSIKIIKNILSIINEYSQTKYKLMSIENIYVFINTDLDKIVSLVLFINETDKYSSRKIHIKYLKKDNKIYILKIETLQSEKIILPLSKDIDKQFLKILPKNNWDITNQMHLLKTLFENQDKNIAFIRNIPKKVNLKHTHIKRRDLPYDNPSLFNDNFKSCNIIT